MSKHLLLFAIGAVCLLSTAWLSGAGAGDMKEEIVPDLNLFRSRFEQTPIPNKTISIYPQGIRFFFSTATKKPQYSALRSFFKLGGDFEISANYQWTPVIVPKGGYGVSCGICIETNDKMRSVSLSRGNLPRAGSAYRVSIGTMKPDRSIEYKNEPPFKTKSKYGTLILMRTKKEIICLAGDKKEEPTELCRIPFTDAAVQRVLIFADPEAAPTDLDARITGLKIRAEETSYHMTKKEMPTGWFNGIWVAGVVVLLATVGFVAVRRIRTGRWSTAQ